MGAFSHYSQLYNEGNVNADKRMNFLMDLYAFFVIFGFSRLYILYFINAQKGQKGVTYE